VPRPLHGRRHVDPARLKSQGIEFGPIDLAHGADAFRIQGAAVDAHRFLQQLQRGGGALFHRSDDSLFRLGKLRLS
jgi:hypothetical protein